MKRITYILGFLFGFMSFPSCSPKPMPANGWVIAGCLLGAVLCYLGFLWLVRRGFER